MSIQCIVKVFIYCLGDISMSKSKKVLRKLTIILIATIIFLFAAFNICWLIYYNKFKVFTQNSSISESHDLEKLGKRYTYFDETQKISYGVVSPKYLKTYGNITIDQDLCINDNPDTDLLYEDEFTIGFTINYTMFSKKKYIVDIGYLGDMKKGSSNSVNLKLFTVDENLNIINKGDYSEEDLQLFDKCKNNISEYYQRLTDFFGKENILDL